MQRRDVFSGVQAGFLSGSFVAVFFFAADLIRWAPLSTPLALMQKLSLQAMPRDGGRTDLDLAAISEVGSGLSFGGGLLALTTLHLVAFALLAVAAVAFFQSCQIPLNAATGAIWGLVAYSLIFELGLAVARPDLVVGVPGFWTVAGVNLLAGAIMGGYVRWSTRGESSRRA